MIRLLDFVLSLLGFIILIPILVFIAIWIKMDSPGPILYIQSRVGRNNIDFKLFKFRTMRPSSDSLGLLTIGGNDPRITNSGLILRKYKLDELPQLLNVIKGDMSLVGPRPEVRKYVDLYDASQREILNVRPGITDEASIYFHNENTLLGNAINPEEVYINEIIPQKIELNKRFINNPSIFNYIKIILKTIFPI